LKGAVLETAFVEAGIPALTVEIGSPRRYDPQKIALAVYGEVATIARDAVS